MATLQIKNLPDDLHASLKERARREHTSLTDLVTRIIRRELALPSQEEWLASLEALPVTDRDIDITALMDEVRGRPPEEEPRARARRQRAS